MEFTELIGTAVEVRLGQLEQARVDPQKRMTEMRLLLEEQENKGRRHNLWIRGVLKQEGTENLPENLQGLFHLMFAQGDGAAIPFKLDRAIRIMWPRSVDLAIPRHIV